MRTRKEEFLLIITGKTARRTSEKWRTNFRLPQERIKGLVAAIACESRKVGAPWNGKVKNIKFFECQNVWNGMSLSQSSRKPPRREFIKVVATRDGSNILENGLSGGGGRYFPYISLNTIETMFSQLAKRSARLLPADLCTDHAHYVKTHRSTVLRRNKIMAVEGGTVSHYYILVIRKFIDFMSLFRHSVWFPFLWNNFPLQSLEYPTYSSV